MHVCIYINDFVVNCTINSSVSFGTAILNLITFESNSLVIVHSS